jgi:thiamine kinase-like enzyme
MIQFGEAATDADREAEALIAEVPGLIMPGLCYRPLCPDVISPVHRGVESALWLLRAPREADRVLKALRHDMRAEFDAPRAVAAARAAGVAGVGPTVLWADETAGILLMEHLGEGWRTATLGDLQDAGVLAAVFAATSRLHEVAAELRHHDVFAEIRDLAARATTVGVALPSDFWWLRDCADRVEAALAGRDIPRVLCRNDGVSSNVMLGPDGSVRLLDYDRAGLNDALYDLGVLLTETCAFETEMVARLPSDLDAAALDRCILYGAMDDLMWALWSAMQAVLSPRVHVEFRKYAEWRFLRCRATLLDRRFEERLRRI